MSDGIEASAMDWSAVAPDPSPSKSVTTPGTEIKAQTPSNMCTAVQTGLGYTVAKPDGQRYEVMEFIQGYVPLEDRECLIKHCQSELIKRTKELRQLLWSSKVEVGIRARLEDAFSKEDDHKVKELQRIQGEQVAKYAPIAVIVFVVAIVVYWIRRSL